jgi:hypothetical protein
MPITIDGSGTITGLSAGGLPDSSITTADIANAAITAAKLDGAQSGSAPIYAARAWVNFNGTGTVAIRASGNVSSITDNGTGDYTVNFTTAMSDANYAVAVTSAVTGGTLRLCNTSGDTAPSTTSRRLSSLNTAFAALDVDYMTATFFR